MNDEAVAEQLLKEGLSELLVEKHHYTALWHYLLLLKKWNKAYNLTAIRELPAMVNRHILDSLAIAPYLKGSRIIDVGTGAGLPGVVLAITQPSREFVLLDSNGKKTRFLNEVKRSLNLLNLQVVQTRVESYHDTQTFDTVVSRAFSELDQFIRWTKHLLAPQGIWLAMKGQHPESELQGIDLPYQIHSYQVPKLESQRCVVIIQNQNKS